MIFSRTTTRFWVRDVQNLISMYRSIDLIYNLICLPAKKNKKKKQTKKKQQTNKQPPQKKTKTKRIAALSTKTLWWFRGQVWFQDRNIINFDAEHPIFSLTLPDKSVALLYITYIHSYSANILEPNPRKKKKKPTKNPNKKPKKPNVCSVMFYNSIIYMG